MFRITIRNLRLRCIIGIKPDERREKQDVVVSICLWADLAKAGMSDSIDDTVNYRSVSKRVIAAVEGSSFNLLEALASSVADVCLDDGRVSKVMVRVDKPGALRFADSVGIELVRERGK